MPDSSDPPPPRRRHGDVLDDMLWNYLQREQEDPIRTRLQNQADWMAKHDREDIERFAALREGQASVGIRLQTLEAKAAKLEEHDEVTGQHEIESLRARAKSPGTFWAGVAREVIALALVGVLGFLAAKLIH